MDEEQIGCLAGCENVDEWEEFIFNAFVNLEPVQRSENGCCDMRKRVQNSSESVGGNLFEIYLILEDCSIENYSSQVWSGE